MLHLRVIVQPTDYSETARIALRHAWLLAQQHDAEVHLLHVDTGHHQFPDGGAWTSRGRAAGPISSAADEQMRAWIEGSLPNVGDAAIRRVHARGTCPEEVILRYAASESADLIVMGHSREGLRRLMLGSVADVVVRHAVAPVYVTGTECPTEATKNPHILVPVDFSRESLVALGHAKALAASASGRLTLLHVLEPAQTLIGIFGGAPEGQLDQLRSHAMESLAQADRDSGYASVVTTYRVVVGYPSSDILTAAHDVEADLIVLSTHGRLGNWRLPLGNVAERVIRSYRGAVLLAKPYGLSLLREDARPPLRRGAAMPKRELA